MCARSVGKRMRRKERARLRGVVRWGVWVCTGVLIVLVLVSIWGRPGARVMHSSTAYANRGVILDLSSGRFRVLFSSGRVVHSYDSVPVVGFDFEYWHRWPMAEKRSTAQLLSPVWWVGGQSIRGPEVSLIYPAVVGAAWSGLIWHRRRRFSAGCCAECGYSLDGLESDVCPECGEKYA